MVKIRKERWKISWHENKEIS